MVTFKRFMHIILIIAVLGSIFFVYNISSSRPAAAETQDDLSGQREFLEAGPVEAGQKPRVWVVGESGEDACGKIYENVLQLCTDLGLTVAGEGRLVLDEVEAQDLLIFCDAETGRHAGAEELKAFVAGGGRVILAAGLAQGDGDRGLWPALGIRYRSAQEVCRELFFEKPLLPVQPEWSAYDGNSACFQLDLYENAAVYIRNTANGAPVLYTYDYGKGSVCCINGDFLADAGSLGLLTGGISALLPDFVYPVLGVKAVFLDQFPMFTPEDDALCGQLYGYSAEGFVRDVLWPAFQGISLRTETPYTTSILEAASAAERFEPVNDAVFTTICQSALQFGGELIYAADCPKGETVAFNEDFISRFSAMFSNYTVQGLALENDYFPPETAQVPGAEIRSIRGLLGGREMRLSWREGRTVFPAGTVGNSLQEGNFFNVCSVLGAYGMVSHVFEMDQLISRDGVSAAWDLDKIQIALFESEILNRAPWLEGRTLTQTEGDVRSYLALRYGWTRTQNRLELQCSGAAKGQAFLYHTGSRIVSAEGLTYTEAGNGYYLLRLYESRASITLEEE